jgi:hypothetical protein
MTSRMGNPRWPGCAASHAERIGEIRNRVELRIGECLFISADADQESSAELVGI